MSKFNKLALIFFIMAIILEIMGIKTGLGEVLNNFGVSISSGVIQTGNLEGSTFWSNIDTFLALIVAGGVVVGFLAKGYDPSLVIAPYIAFVLGLFISTAWTLMLYSQSIGGATWLTNIIGVLFLGLGVGLLATAVDYFRSGT